MLSSQRAGSTTKILAPSQTQDLWTETGFEQETDARREARFRGMSNAGFHRAALSQLQQEFNPDTPMPIGVSVNASQRGPSGEATKSTTVMASAVSNQTLQQQQQKQHEEQSQMSVAVSVGKPMTPLELKQERQRLKNIQAQQEHERQLESQRISRVRQQRINWYRRPKADNMPTEERRAARERLYKTPMHVQPRDKAPTNTGHFLMNGELSPTYEKAGRKYQVGRTPKSRGGVSRDPQQSHRGSQQSHRGGGQMAHRGDRSSAAHRRPKSAPAPAAGASAVDAAVAGGGDESDEKKAPFEGLTVADFLKTDWKPSFTYRPAKQEKPWENLEGFSRSTRTLERRKMNPFVDIQSFNGAGRATGYVRPLDVKGQLGARAVQQWKESLREDFARDDDNYSSNAHDANLDTLREVLGAGTAFSKPKTEIQ
jgi:hypothetical protein